MQRFTQRLTRTVCAVPARGYYQPTPEPRGQAKRAYFDGAADGGIAQFKDMLPDAQDQRAMVDRRRMIHEKMLKQNMTKEEFEKFSEQVEAKKSKSALTKVPTTIEELPQSDKDWLAGKSKAHPLEHHPFVMKRAKAMLAGTWIPAVARDQDPQWIDEFKQKINKPDAWIEYLDKWEGDFWDELSWVSPRMGQSRCKETMPYLKSLLRAMLRAKKGQNERRVGNLPCAMMDIIYDHKFVMGQKPDGEVWGLVLEATVQNGEWRLGYLIEDIMTEMKYQINADHLKQLDELAEYAYQKGYLEPPRLQGRDLSDIFKIDTAGGVGAYYPMPRGETFGYELFKIYEQQKKDGTFRPAVNTPAWDEYVKDKPELQGKPATLLDSVKAK